MPQRKHVQPWLSDLMLTKSGNYIRKLSNEKAKTYKNGLKHNAGGMRLAFVMLI